MLVLDEADRLLEENFNDEVREVVKSCPRQRQTMLFSATLSEEVNTVHICVDLFVGLLSWFDVCIHFSTHTNTISAQLHLQLRLQALPYQFFCSQP